MKIRTLLGLAAIGGVAYAHNRRGGEWTLEGIKGTVRDLFSGVTDKVRGFADEAKDEIGSKSQDFGATASRSSDFGVSSDLGGYNR